MSLRLAVATHEGFDDSTAEKIDRYESSDLAARHKVALRLADALITSPRSMPPELRDAALGHFDREEVIELTLDVMKWSYQKVVVALGVDAEVAPGRLTELRFDADGRPLL